MKFCWQKKSFFRFKFFLKIFHTEQNLLQKKCLHKNDESPLKFVKIFLKFKKKILKFKKIFEIWKKNFFEI